MEELYALRKQVNQWATCNSTLWLQQQNKKKTVAINSVIYPPSPLKKKKKNQSTSYSGMDSRTNRVTLTPQPDPDIGLTLTMSFHAQGNQN